MNMLLRAGLWLSGGMALGGFFLLSLAMTVAHFQPYAGRRWAWRFVGGYLLRLTLVGGALRLALLQGIVPALWLLLGFWLMRMFLIWRIHQGRAFQRYLRV